MEANSVQVKEVVSAGKKLQEKDARAIAKASSRILVAKGKSLKEFKGGASFDKDAIPAMLGTTGNLRAPLVRVGKTTRVGYNEDLYGEHLLQG
jgi:arsenate reductase-like glutaredoxin family protein